MTPKLSVFCSTEKSANQRDILDCRVLSGQSTGIKDKNCIFGHGLLYLNIVGHDLTMSMNRDYADIKSLKISFLKSRKFSPLIVHLKCLPAQ